MNKYDDKWDHDEKEWHINALLDGELDEADAEALKSAATEDHELARAIVEAHQLQQAMDGLHVERAPASLRKKLQAIPREQRRATSFSLFQPRWVTALAAIPLVVIALMLMQPDTPSESEIAKARQELAIAFAYLDKAGRFTSREIESTVGNTMSDAIAGSVIRNIKSQYEPSKESEA